MLVKAAPGLRVPKENKPREYITEGTAVEVPATAYYLRALASGDLIEEATTAPKAKAPATSQAKE